MEEKLFELNLDKDCLEIVLRDGQYFVRYDAGSQQVVWREDQISEAEAFKINSSKTGENEVLVNLQRRLGLDAYISNWTPPIR